MRSLALRLAVLPLLVLCLALATPIAGAQSTPSLPRLAELSSVRINYVSTFNGEPGVVCQDELASANRVHGTCRELVTAQYPEIGIDLVAGRITEYVYYDGTSYTRVGDELTWTSEVDPNYDPSITLNELLFGGYLTPGNVAITTIGRSTVGSSPTTQYQFWSLDSELNETSGGQLVYDVFVSDQGYVLKDQVSNRGSFPMGEGELASIWTYSDFNAPMAVSPPPAESVRAAGRTQMSRVSPVLLDR